MDGGELFDIKGSLNDSFIRSFADDVGADFMAREEMDSLNEEGFPGAGFTSEDMKASIEGDRRGIDKDKRRKRESMYPTLSL